MHTRSWHFAMASTVLVLALGAMTLSGCGVEGSKVAAPQSGIEPGSSGPAESPVISAEAAEAADAAGPSLGSSPAVEQRDTPRQVICSYYYPRIGPIGWTYYHEVDFRYDGIHVTSVPIDRDWAVLAGPLWTWQQYGSSHNWGPANLWYYSQKTGLFERHLYQGGPVVQRVQVTIWIRVWGTGFYNCGNTVL
jgi:hypothetical protein